MKFLAPFLLLASLVSAFEKPNVLLLCIDDLRPELGCYGIDYIQSPHIDHLADSGHVFTHHYVQAPTCGASRYALLTGHYPIKVRGNQALFTRAKHFVDPPDTPSLPRHFRDHGYTTVSVGKVSHHPGGRGGQFWNDDSAPELPKAWTKHLQPVGPWEHPRGFMHGLANGASRFNTEKLDALEAFDGPDQAYPDGLTTDRALSELSKLTSSDTPFFLAVGILRPHLPFGAPKQYLDLYEEVTLPPIPHPMKPQGKSTWHPSREFFNSYNHHGKNPNEDTNYANEVRRHYAACVSYADAQVGRILNALDESGHSENTIVVLWGDHGWHLGEHSLWGKHALFEESLRSPLIIRTPHTKQPKRTFSTTHVVETVDIFPTLCDLAGLPQPETLDGQSLESTSSEHDRGTAISFQNHAVTIRSDRYRLILHKDGFLELYDHDS
ncbi:MAG: sulfatase, partial [Verrucomicrobiales bacterium]